MKVIIVLLVVGVVSGAPERRRRRDGSHGWGYSQSNGPATWAEHYELCGGESQSPINLENAETEAKTDQFVLSDEWSITGEIWEATNNGHTAVVTLPDGFTVSGGNLPGDSYTAVQFHFHWGAKDSRGSEHTVDGTAYPLEMHIVTYDDAYENIGEAKPQPDGLAVLGFFFTIGNENDDFDPIVETLRDIRNPEDQAEVYGMNMLDLIVDSVTGSFFRYHGSLTTPTCDESVIWTNFKQPITISKQQLKRFRKLMGDETNLVDNYRPVQPLNDRVVEQYRQFSNEEI